MKVNKEKAIKEFEKWIDATGYNSFDIVDDCHPSWVGVKQVFKIFTGVEKS